MSNHTITPAPPTETSLNRPELRGRAAGITILVFFALAWVSWGSSTGVRPRIQIWTAIGAGIVAAALVATVISILLRARTAPVGGDAPRGRAVGRRFGIVVGVEFAGLGLLAWLLGATGQQRWIPAVVCLGVGVHFFPLARLFGIRLYAGTGLAMSVIAALTPILALSTGNDIWWTALPGFGSAVALLATCAILAGSTLRAVRC